MAIHIGSNIKTEASFGNINQVPAPVKIWSRYTSAQHQSMVDHLGKHLAPLILLITDYLAVFLAVRGAFWMRFLIAPKPFTFQLPVGWHNIHFYFVIPLFYMGLIFYERLYQRRLPFWQNVGKLFKICTFATVFTISVMYFTGSAKFLSRLFVLLIWLFSCVLLITVRYFTKRLLMTCQLWRRRVIIVGTGSSLGLLMKTFNDEPNLGYQIVGVIEESYSKRIHNHKYQVLGNLNNMEEAIIHSGVSEVIIAIPELKRCELLELVDRIQPLVKNVTIFPDLHGLPLNNLEADTFFNQKTVLLRVRNNLLDYRNLFFKRIFDLVMGIFILAVSLPVMALIAVLIKLDSPGPAFYKGRRLGKGGHGFKCYKFRTMFVNEGDILENYFTHNEKAKEEWDKFAKLRFFDPRVTRIGCWLRKFSLDELPQIFNVIKGEMSLVGPRPYLPREQELMKHYSKTIFETWPGITGLWQVRGRNELPFEERLSLEAWYVRNWSIWLDTSLMLKTIQVVLERKGAY